MYPAYGDAWDLGVIDGSRAGHRGA
jgi:hypothetical protein